jgi:hypothetical protein
MLLAVELNTTIFTTICIDWHTKPSFLPLSIIVVRILDIKR